MDYRPNAKRIEEGKSPLLNSNFCLSKSSKRMLCNARNSNECALIVAAGATMHEFSRS